MAEGEDKDGGYDCDLIEEPPDDLICPICLLPPRKPHLISCCGRKLCHSCIDRVKQAGQPCPCCREEKYIIVKDKMVERQVLDLKVYCTNKSKGCYWNGELRDLEKHTESCYVTSAELLAETQAEEIKKVKKELDDVTSHLQQIQVFSDRKEDELIAAQNTIKQLKEENEILQTKKNEVVEHENEEEIETLKEENRKLHDKVDGLSRQETAMKKKNDNLNGDNHRLRRQLKELKQSLQYTQHTAPPPPHPYHPPPGMPLHQPYRPQGGGFSPHYCPPHDMHRPPHDMHRPPHDMHRPPYHKHHQQFN